MLVLELADRPSSSSVVQALPFGGADLEETAPLRSRTILVVEDFPDAREAIAEVLKDDGYWVRTEIDGAAALTRLRNGLQPDVIVLDLMLPGMDGEQVLSAMAADPALAAIPVVIITAKPRRDPLPVFPNVRATIRKPFPFVRLLDEIRLAYSSGGATQV